MAKLKVGSVLKSVGGYIKTITQSRPRDVNWCSVHFNKCNSKCYVEFARGVLISLLKKRNELPALTPMTDM